MADFCLRGVRLLLPRAGLWACLILVLCLLSLLYTRQHIGIQTKTANMFSEKLPFRQQQIRLNASFPMLDDTMLVVVEAPTHELADIASTTLVQHLEATDGVFTSVYAPRIEPFMQSHGLLFLSEEELAEKSKRLIEAQPVIGALAHDPSVRGVFQLVAQMLPRLAASNAAANLDPLLINLYAALEQPEAPPLSWLDLTQKKAGDTAETPTRFIQIKPQMDYSRWLPAKPAMLALRAAIQECQKEFESSLGTQTAMRIRMHVTGEKAMGFEEMKSAAQGAATASVLALLMVSIVLWLALRSWRLIAAVMLTLLSGLLLTGAFAAGSIGSLNMISVAFAVLYIGLGVDYMIHLCMRFRELVIKGVSSREALLASVHEIAPSLVLCALSTSAGFYAFLPTDFEGVSELGLIAGTSMFISLFMSLTLLPCLLSKCLSDKPQQDSENSFAGGPPRPGLLEIPLRYPRGICCAGGLLALLAIAPAVGVKFDEDPINLRDPESESVATLRTQMKAGHLSPWQIEWVSNSPEAVENAARAVRDIPGIGRVMTLQSWVPQNQETKLAILDDLALMLEPSFLGGKKPPPATEETLAAMSAALETLQALPEGTHTEAMLALMEMLDNWLSKNTDPNKLKALEQRLTHTLPHALQQLNLQLTAQQVSPDKLPETLRSRWVSPAGLYRLQAEPEETQASPEALRELRQQVSAALPDASGKLIVTLESADAVVSSFRQALLLAILAALIIVVTYLRSLKDTCLVMAPLALAGLYTLACMELLEQPLNFANIIALPLLLGLGVDNGIHIIHRVRTHSHEQFNLMHSSTTRAIFFSAATTLVGFGNLAFSPHTGTASMGILLTVGVIATLLSTLVLLPALVQWLDTHKKANP